MSERHRLYKNQQHLLLLVFKFRFVTAPYLALLNNKHRDTIKRSLETLVNKGLLGRHFPSQYKLANRAAEYYITKEGIRYLRSLEKPVLSSNALNATYKDKSASQAFIDTSLRTLEIYLHLEKEYKELEIFTRSGIRRYEGFPTPYPNLYMQGKNQYMLDIFEEKYFFLIKKRIKKLEAHADDEGWPYHNEDVYPTCLLVVPSIYLKKKTLSYIEEFYSDVTFLVATVDELLCKTSEAIWQGSDDEEPAKRLAV